MVEGNLDGMSTPKKAIGAKKATPAKRTRKVSVPDHGRNRSAIEIMVASLREAGRLEPVDEARVIAACALADAVDADPTNASLWREYRAAVETLRQASDGGTDEFATLLAGLSAEVGDATNRRTGHPRS
jgi:hypothetical protein